MLRLQGLIAQISRIEPNAQSLQAARQALVRLQSASAALSQAAKTGDMDSLFQRKR